MTGRCSEGPHEAPLCSLLFPHSSGVKSCKVLSVALFVVPSLPPFALFVPPSLLILSAPLRGDRAPCGAALCERAARGGDLGAVSPAQGAPPVLGTST